MSILPITLLFWCAAFAVAGWHAEAGWDWPNLLCTEATFLCAQPYWLAGVAAITAIPAIYHEMRT
jgi:hypothetical protein